MIEKDINLRSECWQFIVYPDPPEGCQPNNHFLFDDIVARLQTSGACFAYIFHDKDDNTPHYHFVCKWTRKVYMSTLQSITGHTSRMAYQMFAESELSYKVRYLTHKDNADKAPYDDNDVVLVGWGPADYDLMCTAVQPVQLSNDDKAQRMCDLCLAYVSHQLTLQECIAHLPAIAFNVRNFLTLANAIRVERSEEEYNDALAYKADSHGIAEQWQHYYGVWKDFQRK